jgi:arginyl-tRNA synthetase
MHIGHCRGAVVGDALANLLAKVGYDVTKEFYLNDAGNQVTALAWAAYWRYLQALGTELTEQEFSAAVPEGLQYRGEYLIEVGAALAGRYGDTLAAPGQRIAAPDLWLETVRDFALARMLASVKQDLAALGVVQDVFTSERALVRAGRVAAAIARLKGADLVYEGILEPPKGKPVDDWEPRTQLLFRATRFGDDVDRPLQKSDGSFTYFANDIAYHVDKLARGAELMIDVWGADHGGYVRRMQAAARAFGGVLDIVLCQIVHVMKGGEPLRMSKRAGTFITLRDLLDEVGPDAVRFTMLTRKADAQMEFDIDEAVAQTRENPVFYVQYAHARCRSVLRAAAETLGEAAVAPAALAEAELASLADPAELALMRSLGAWPRCLEAAALAREPHRIAFFLYDLAADFHMLWHRGRDDAALRFLQAGRPVETLARVALVAATAATIRSGLAVMGVTPVEEMR